MIDKKEIWEDVFSFEGYYQVSNKGNCRSVERKVTNSNGSVRVYKGKKLKPFKTNGGYLSVCMSINNKSNNYLIHRLVGEYFVMNRYNKLEINHIDGVKTNNNADNLEWVTRQENITHSIETGLRNGYPKLEKEKIIKDYLRGKRFDFITKENKVSKRRIYKILENKGIKTDRIKTKNNKKEIKEFAYYEGDTFVTVGTAKEIEEFTGLSESITRRISSPKYLSEVKEYQKRMIEID